MEDNNKIEKETFASYRKIASGLLTAIVIITFFWKYMPAILLGITLLFGSLGVVIVPSITNIAVLLIIATILIDIRALYLYIKYTLDLFVKKKRIRSILLAIILIAVVVLFRIQENFMQEKFVLLTYSILLVTCMSIIPIIRTILDLIRIWKNYKTEKKDLRKNVIKTVAIIIVIVATQAIMGTYSYFVTNIAIEEFKTSDFSEIFALKKKKETVAETNNTNLHISESQRNIDATFTEKKLREDWITISNVYNEKVKGATNYTFKNDINLKTDEKNLKYMKVCFQLKDDLTNFVPVEDKEENYNMIDSYLIASSVMEITLKPGVQLENKYYTVRFNRYDENFNIQANCKYIFEPVAEIGTDSKGRQVIFVNYKDVYPLGELKNIEFILGKE